MSICCWTTYTDPKTLINVGTDVVASTNYNVVCFTDLKTNQKNFIRPSTKAQGYGVSRIIGHKRFPMFAYVEKVMRPNIFVVRYPDLVNIHVFQSNDVLTYIDLAFSDYDHLVALSGYPHYILRIWNCRTGQFLVEKTTNWKCSTNSLLCSSRNIPLILQRSIWHRDITFYEMQLTADRTNLHEVSKVVFTNDYTLSLDFNTCFTDDNGLYVVNDYGMVSSVEIAEFSLKRQWATHFVSSGKPRQHSLFPLRSGLMVVNSDTVIYIKKLRGLWAVEWVLPGPHGIVKMLTNYNSEVYTNDEVGNLYLLNELDYEAELVGVHTGHYRTLDYTLLRGSKEENIVMLTEDGYLHASDIQRNSIYSSVQVEDATCVTAHNTFPYLAAGTRHGTIHFIAYEKLRAPVRLKVLDLEDGVEIKCIRLADRLGYIQNRQNRMFYALTDFKQEDFFVICKSKTRENIRLLNYALFEDGLSLAFGTYDRKAPLVTANKCWMTELMTLQRQVKRTVFDLPKNYRCVTFPNTSHRDAIEILAIPSNDFVVDILILRDTKEIVLSASILTGHSDYLVGVMGVRNMVTWSQCSTIYQFRSHKKSNKPYGISRGLHFTYVPLRINMVEECYNGKYLIFVMDNGSMKVYRLTTLADNLRENTYLPIMQKVIEAGDSSLVGFAQETKFVVRTIKPEEREMRAQIEQRVRQLEAEVTALIDYDISVTQRNKNIYRKFCLNYIWLEMVNKEARILCDIERKSLMDSITDKERIRRWILNLVTQQTQTISVKVRAIFTNAFFDNYSTRKDMPKLRELYDLYRLEDMEVPEDEEQDEDEVLVSTEANTKANAKHAEIEGNNEEEKEKGGEGEEEETAPPKKIRKRYKVVDESVFDHVMAEEFQVQDKNRVTGNQLLCENIKFELIYHDPLKQEFNKKFLGVQDYKQEIMNNILGTNATLLKIFENMNIMLHLLHMETFTPEALSVPALTNDEQLERIMTVDDSEIKAINRRKKKAVVADEKRGRLLLWSVDFWIRALNTMMDGVLEKLWEEEIKKTPPEPEFVSKKSPHDYSLEEQKLFRLYEETLRLLAEDRRKYLRILRDNEVNTSELKNRYIYKFNEKCAEMTILKLKYDYAIQHLRVRLLTTKIAHFRRFQRLKHMRKLKSEMSQVTDYIARYTKLIEFFEHTIGDLRSKLDNLNSRQQYLDRSFKGQFLPTVPAYLAHELAKLFRRRPKIPQRAFNSSLVCFEVAGRISHKSGTNAFPLTSDVGDYLKGLEALDHSSNAPAQLDPKLWDAFNKIRHQKIETELKTKGSGFFLAASQATLNNFTNDLSNLKTKRLDLQIDIDQTIDKYFEEVQDQYLQITLSMGQVEVTLGGSLTNLHTCMLMNLDDLNAVNDLIKVAGAKKLRTMMRLAVFRRQVIFREWEHQVFRANIEYLKYMLQIIEKCKITKEFLEILRNWKKVKEARKTFVGTSGVIERAVDLKIQAYRKNLDRINEKIDVVRDQIAAIKIKNQQVNRQIDDVRVSVAMFNANRDVIMEERRDRERRERMNKIKIHSTLMDTVRNDYAHILELKTLLELQRLRTYPTLGPLPDECPIPEGYKYAHGL